MTLCPVALSVGCKKCPAFGFCFLKGVIGDLTAMRDRPDSTELLGGILEPVLVIHGQADQLIPPSEAEAAFARLPNARLALVPRAGHLVNLEQPEAFDAEVRTFLKSF